MKVSEIKNLSDSYLLKRTEELAGEERRVQIEFIHHLREVKRRGLHLAGGADSLFTYLTRGLKYDEGVAYRRIRAMELLEEIPDAEVALEQGRMTLTSASQLQGFFRSEAKAGKELPIQEKQKLFERVQGLSKSEVERVLAAISPESVLPERERVISETQTEIRFVADQELMLMLEKIKNLMAHRNPDPSYLELFKTMARITLKKIDPILKAEKPKAVKNIKEKSDKPSEVQVNHSNSEVVQGRGLYSSSKGVQDRDPHLVMTSNQDLNTENTHAGSSGNVDQFHLNPIKQVALENLSYIRQIQTTALEKLEYKSALNRIHDFKLSLPLSTSKAHFYKDDDYQTKIAPSHDERMRDASFRFIRKKKIGIDTLKRPIEVKFGSVIEGSAHSGIR